MFFNLLLNSTEMPSLSNGASVKPTLASSSLVGTVVVKGSGSVDQNPNGDGASFHLPGKQNKDSAYLNFTGATAIAAMVGGSKEFSVTLRSNHSFAERAAFPDNAIRSILEVRDDSKAGFYLVSEVVTSHSVVVDGQKIGVDGQNLQFGFGAHGTGAVYTVPKGQEDTVFGKGVEVKITVKWTPTTVGFFINDTLVQTNQANNWTPKWSDKSAFNVGAMTLWNGSSFQPGFVACDDTVSDLSFT